MMRSATATDSRARSRRTPLATLLALLALCTLAQALAPAGAAAVANQESAGECMPIAGLPFGRNANNEFCNLSNPGESWPMGDIYPAFGTTPTLPKPPAETPKPKPCSNPSSCMPGQFGPDGKTRGGETSRPGPKDNDGVKPEASGEKKPPKRDKAKDDKAERIPNKDCVDLRQSLKTFNSTIRTIELRLQLIGELRAKGLAYDPTEGIKSLLWKMSLEKARTKAEADYGALKCYYRTGIPLPSR